MPRFFFDIREQDGVQFDQVGIELPDLAAAREEARKALGELMQQEIATRGTGAISIEIRTEDGSVAADVTAASDDRKH